MRAEKQPRGRFPAAVAAVLLGATLSAQAPATLAVAGAVKTPLTLTKADLQSMARNAPVPKPH